MASTGWQPIIGNGYYDFGAERAVDEIAVKLTDLGPSHIHDGGDHPRIQHAGLVGIYYINDVDSLHDIIWWKFIDFANEDTPLVAMPFGAHGMFWNLALGVEGNMLAHWP